MNGLLNILRIVGGTKAGCDNGIKTALIDIPCENLKNGTAIFDILAFLLNILTFGVGVAAVIGFLISGYQYMTARDNAAMVTKAKTRILHIVIGILVWALLWIILQLLLPGGVFGDGS